MVVVQTKTRAGHTVFTDYEEFVNTDLAAVLVEAGEWLREEPPRDVIYVAARRHPANTWRIVLAMRPMPSSAYQAPSAAK